MWYLLKTFARKILNAFYSSLSVSSLTLQHLIISFKYSLVGTTVEILFSCGEDNKCFSDALNLHR